MVKDAFEDYKRAQSDKEENETLTKVYNHSNKSFEPTKWEEIAVGDIVYIVDEEYIPADIVVFRSSDPKGECYIETKGLDGETNLKLKSSAKEVVKIF